MSPDRAYGLAAGKGLGRKVSEGCAAYRPRSGIENDVPLCFLDGRVVNISAEIFI